MDSTLAQNIVKKLTTINLPPTLKQQLLDAVVILDDESLKNLDQVLDDYKSFDQEVESKFNKLLSNARQKYEKRKEENKNSFLKEIDGLTGEIDSNETIANS